MKGLFIHVFSLVFILSSFGLYAEDVKNPEFTEYSVKNPHFAYPKMQVSRNGTCTKGRLIRFRGRKYCVLCPSNHSVRYIKGRLMCVGCPSRYFPVPINGYYKCVSCTKQGFLLKFIRGKPVCVKCDRGYHFSYKKNKCVSSKRISPEDMMLRRYAIKSPEVFHPRYRPPISVAPMKRSRCPNGFGSIVRKNGRIYCVKCPSGYVGSLKYNRFYCKEKCPNGYVRVIPPREKRVKCIRCSKGWRLTFYRKGKRYICIRHKR